MYFFKKHPRSSDLRNHYDQVANVYRVHKSKPIVFFVIVTLKLVDRCLLFNSTFSTNRLYHAMEV